MENLDAEDTLTAPADQYYIEEVTPETDPGYTTRSDQAVDEGLPWVPPTDPPVIASGDEGAAVATGFGTSPEDAPYRANAPDRDAWIQEEVQRVLAEDSATSKLPIMARVEAGTVILEGYVSDEEDTELAETVAAQVPGVIAVDDRTEINPDVVEHVTPDFVTPNEQS